MAKANTGTMDEDMDEEELEKWREEMLAEAGEVAKDAAKVAADAAKMDALARRSKAGKAQDGPADGVAAQLQKLKAENEALKKLALEMASNKSEVESRIQSLMRVLSTGSTADPEVEAQAAAAAAADAKLSEEEAAKAAEDADKYKEEEVTKVVVGLQVAKKMAKEKEEMAKEKEEAAAKEKAKATSLPVLAEAALKAKKPFFTSNPDGMPVDTRGALYYNRAAGPIPAGNKLYLKAGMNGWETIMDLDMNPAQELNAQMKGADWWVVDMELSIDVFKVDFVIMSSTSDAVDNNRSKDFQLPLLGALTEEEIIAKRIAEFEAFEAKRQAEIEEEESKLWEQVLVTAEEEADAASKKLLEATQRRRRSAAEEVVKERRNERVSALKLEASRAGVFGWIDGPTAGKTGTLLYNRDAGPLRGANGLMVHMGFDGWYLSEKIETNMTAVPKAKFAELGLPAAEAGQWFQCTVDIPMLASVADFVFSSQDRVLWDNGANQDFHSQVLGALSLEALVDKVYSRMVEAEKEVDAKADVRCRRAAIMRVTSKAKALRSRRDRQREIVFTDPVFPTAGDEVDIYYRADRTVLRGRPEIWARGSYNRYQHPECWMPIKLIPSTGGVLKTSEKIKVPEDAAMMDVVFSDTGNLGGGFFDNNSGWDYHIEIKGSTGQIRPLKVVHMTVEMAPVAKVGGMGDVVPALGRAVMDEGHEVTVILPKYDILKYDLIEGMREEQSFHWGGCNNRVFRGVVNDLDVVFLEPDNGFFWVGCVYGRNDDAARFAFFNGVAQEYLHRSGLNPDIVHCHDWQTAPACYGGAPGKKVFTIHNLNYGVDLVGQAMAACTVATTVSPTYALEIAGHAAIAPNLSKMMGVINGIDFETWDPAQDEFLPIMYGSEDAVEGKAAARRELRNRFNLSQTDVPVVAVVTRLTHQKGIHLIKHAAWRSLERGAQFVLLGSAPDPRVQAEFQALANDLGRQYPDRARLWFAFDEPLSHLMYAGSDMCLVPSMFEPCGLTQMISMRYGSIPVVRRTGGLNDSVFDVDHDEDRARENGLQPNGFNFEGADTAGMDYALNRALSLWFGDRDRWNKLTKTVMEQDWSWNLPALDYIELYYKALKN